MSAPHSAQNRAGSSNDLRHRGHTNFCAGVDIAACEHSTCEIRYRRGSRRRLGSIAGDGAPAHRRLALRALQATVAAIGRSIIYRRSAGHSI
jgi:hypothetical protein